MDQIAGSLKRLQLDHVDLYQIHGFDPVTPIEETLRALDDCVSRGLVRTHRLLQPRGLADHEGAGRFPSGAASPASRRCRPITPSPGATSSANLPLVEDQGLGVMVWSPLAGGFLSGKFTREGAKANDARRAVVRLPAGRQGARLRRHRRDAADRRDARRVGRARRARLAAAAQGRDERHHRRQDASSSSTTTSPPATRSSPPKISPSSTRSAR